MQYLHAPLFKDNMNTHFFCVLLKLVLRYGIGLLFLCSKKQKRSENQGKRIKFVIIASNSSNPRRP